MSMPVRIPPRVRSLAPWALPGLLAAAFLYFGISKLLGDAGAVASYEEIGAGQWLRYATASTEVLGGLALLYRPLAGLAAGALTVQMVGAAVTQVAVVDDGSPVLPIVLGVLTATVAWLRRDETALLLRRYRTPSPHVD